MFEAVIFDLDGLLIDSEKYWRQATAMFFARHGKKYTPAINVHVMGMGAKDIAEYFKQTYGFTGNITDLANERRNLTYEFLLKDVKLMPGAKNLIKKFSGQNMPLAIATSGHSRPMTGKIIHKLGVDQFFKVLVSGDDFAHAKPAPDIYLKTAELLGILPSQCLVFEDSPTGALAGKAAGMTVFGVNKDKALQEKLRAAGANKISKSLSGIDPKDYAKILV